MIQILILAANPTGTPTLNLKSEIKKIDCVLKKSRFKNQFKLIKKHSITTSQLQEALLKFEPQVVHFSGHGSTESALVFEQEGGQIIIVPPQALTKLFEIVNRNNQITHCIILNACYSARQAKAISQHVPCVIGMTNEISDKAAITFATSFYRGLSYGQSIKEAYDLGRNELELQDINESSIIKLLHKRNIVPAKIYLVKKNDVPSEISSESNLENHIHILLENPKFKGRDIDTITKTYGITKGKSITIVKKLGAVRIISERNKTKPYGEFWGIISHVIKIHFARSPLTYINYKYLLGNFEDKRNNAFQNRFNQVLKSICSQSYTNKALWRLK